MPDNNSGPLYNYVCNVKLQTSCAELGIYTCYIHTHEEASCRSLVEGILALIMASHSTAMSYLLETICALIKWLLPELAVFNVNFYLHIKVAFHFVYMDENIYWDIISKMLHCNNYSILLPLICVFLKTWNQGVYCAFLCKISTSYCFFFM